MGCRRCCRSALAVGGNLGLEHSPVEYTLHQQARPIAQAVGGREVAQEHDRHVALELDVLARLCAVLRTWPRVVHESMSSASQKARLVRVNL